MKFIVPTILLACLFALSTSLQTETRGLFCSACKFLWNEVRKELPVVAGDGDAELKKVVADVCKKYTNSIPLLGQLCSQFGNDVIEDVYQLILTEDKKINPDKICAHLKKC